MLPCEGTSRNVLGLETPDAFGINVNSCFALSKEIGRYQASNIDIVTIQLTGSVRDVYITVRFPMIPFKSCYLGTQEAYPPQSDTIDQNFNWT